MEQVAKKVKDLVHENSHEVYDLTAQMIELSVVQGAVGRLLHQLDEIVHKKWHEDRGIAAHSLLEIQDTVRLIDMAFYPMCKKMQETANVVEGISNELFNIIIKPNGGKPSINSLIGWNYQAMELNIATFKREFGREPESFEEVASYILEVCDNVKKATATTVTNEN